MKGLTHPLQVKRADWYDGYKQFTGALADSPLAAGVDIKTTDRGLKRFGKQVFNFGTSFNPLGYVARSADHFANDRWGKGCADAGGSLLSSTGVGGVGGRFLTKLAPAATRKAFTYTANATGTTALAGGMTNDMLRNRGRPRPNTFANTQTQRPLNTDLLNTHA